jgi:hypothetical protein
VSVDIHKPKPWHGLRDFLKEYAIIVVGVLTALAAEQGVQALDWQRRVADAEHDFHVELAANADRAYLRLATVRCARAQIDATRSALVAHRDHGTPITDIAPYRRGTATWFTDSWEAARGLQLTGHLQTEKLQAYSLAYTLAARFSDWQRTEQDLKPGVDSLLDSGGQPTPQERDRLFLALRTLEEHSAYADLVAFRYLEALRPLGVAVDPKRAAANLGNNRQLYGDCAQDPTPWLNDGDKAVGWLMNRKGEP